MYKMMTYYQQLSMEIDKLKAEGKLVSIKQLPSTVNYKSKTNLLR